MFKPVWWAVAGASASAGGEIVKHASREVAGTFANVLQLAEKTLTLDASNRSSDSTPHAVTLNELIDSVSRSLQRHLRSAGVEFDGPITLELSDVTGQLEIRGDVPGKVVLEALFSQDAQLQDDVNQLLGAVHGISEQTPPVGATPFVRDGSIRLPLHGAVANLVL